MYVFIVESSSNQLNETKMHYYFIFFSEAPWIITTFTLLCYPFTSSLSGLIIYPHLTATIMIVTL